MEPVFEKGYPSYEAVNQERYYDYMLRKSREADAAEGIDHRPDRALIRELQEKVKRLEIDMAHVLSQK